MLITSPLLKLSLLYHFTSTLQQLLLVCAGPFLAKASSLQKPLSTKILFFVYMVIKTTYLKYSLDFPNETFTHGLKQFLAADTNPYATLWVWHCEAFFETAY